MTFNPPVFVPSCLQPVYTLSFCSCATCFSVLSCCFALAQLSHITPSPHFANFILSPSSAIQPTIHFSRNRMPAPTSQQNPRQRATNSSYASTPTSVGEVNGRVDQLALVQQALQDGSTPTMIAGFAMIVAQMQAQAAHPEVLLTITTSIGPLERSATFRDGTWHGYDLTHSLIDPRSHMIYGEPTRPSMDQERPKTEFLHQPYNHYSKHRSPYNHIPWLLLHR